jgi:hypothetical protein
MTPTPLTMKIQEKLNSPKLQMDTPDFVIVAAEYLANQGDNLHSDTVGFLVTRVENDTKVN